VILCLAGGHYSSFAARLCLPVSSSHPSGLCWFHEATGWALVGASQPWTQPGDPWPSAVPKQGLAPTEEMCPPAVPIMGVAPELNASPPAPNEPLSTNMEMSPAAPSEALTPESRLRPPAWLARYARYCKEP
jgi:hypothetical protein